MEENRILEQVLHMNLETTRLRVRPWNSWQDEVNGRISGGEGWKEKVYKKEEWRKLLRTARNHWILHMPMNEWKNYNSLHTSSRTSFHTLHSASFICNIMYSHKYPESYFHFSVQKYVYINGQLIALFIIFF